MSELTTCFTYSIFFNNYLIIGNWKWKRDWIPEKTNWKLC